MAIEPITQAVVFRLHLIVNLLRRCIPLSACDSGRMGYRLRRHPSSSFDPTGGSQIPDKPANVGLERGYYTSRLDHSEQNNQNPEVPDDLVTPQELYRSLGDAD